MGVHKTEAVLITTRRKFRTPRLTINSVDIEWKRKLSYLGVEINKGLSFGPHIDKVAMKASKIIVNLSRLMLNIGGAEERKRKLIASVTTSQMLYAASAWGEAGEKVPA